MEEHDDPRDLIRSATSEKAVLATFLCPLFRTSSPARGLGHAASGAPERERGADGSGKGGGRLER
jgi:hypothetical protein